MGIALFSILGISLFLIGIFLVYRGMAAAPDKDTGFDQADYDQVCAQYAALQQEEQELKIRLNSLAVELEASRAQSREAERFKREAEALRKGEDEAREKIRCLEEGLQFLSRKADQQAHRAIDAIQQLKSRRERLMEQLAVQKSTVSLEDFQRLQQQEAEIQEQLAEGRDRIVRLEKDLEAVRETADAELEVSRESAEGLRNENKVFAQGVQDILAKIFSVSQAFQRLRHEKTSQLQNARNLIDRLRRDCEEMSSRQDGTERQEELERELSRIKSENEGRLSEAHETISRIEGEMRVLQGELQESRQRGVVLQQKIDELPKQDRNEGLEKELNELRETNQFLRQKERLLSQELLRSQTQALGLEKICLELKKQTERR